MTAAVNAESPKNYFLMDGIGTCKYVVNFHDGEKTYGDGSPFYDIRIFSNKRKRDTFIRDLVKQGYSLRSQWL